MFLGFVVRHLWILNVYIFFMDDYVKCQLIDGVLCA